MKLSRAVSVYLSVCSHMLLVKYFLTACLVIWLVVVVIVTRCVECIPVWGITSADYWPSLCEDPASCPHLYLYSIRDALIPYKDVERMIAVRRSRGVRVLTQCWDDSAHVAHLVSHPEVYTVTCLDFLQYCLPAA